MADSPNIYVSNGTCYYNQGYEADSSMIPCGNDYFAHAACCQANDTCLESNACYNGEYGVTYIVGCTDSSYESGVCSDKYEDLNDPTWMGMSYCNSTSNEWILCNQPDDPSTIESPAPCSCPTATSDRTMTMSASSSLTATASLPSAVGLEINYMAGYYPTSPIAKTATASKTQQPTSGGQGVTVTVTPTPSSQSTATSPTSKNLSTNAIIGIAVGASVGGMLLLAALVFYLRRWLLQKQDQERKQSVDATNSDGGNEKAPTGSPKDTELANIGSAQNSNTDIGHSSRVVTPQASTVSGLDGYSARPWSMSSEADGTVAGRNSSVASPARMASIWEQSDRTGPAELAANSLVELEA